MKAIRLNRSDRLELDYALAPHALTPALRSAIEGHLTAYQEVERYKPTAKAYARWCAEKQERIETARRLLDLLSTDLDDHLEAFERETEHSVLYELLEARLAKWEFLQPNPRRAARPQDLNRRVLLWRVIDALDEAGIKQSYHKDGPRVRVLREVLRLVNDLIDRKTPGRGGLRLIISVYRHRSQRDTLGDRFPRNLRLLYEGRGGWPPVHETHSQ